jgi:4-aminobutyrate aminotransferase-like enzyme
MTSDETSRRNPTGERDALFMSHGRHQLYSSALVIERGSKEHLYDLDGNQYLDCFSGIMVTNCGHCSPDINARIAAQLDQLHDTSTFYLTRPVLDLAARLAEVTPDGLARTFFVNSGSEAGDGAIVLARAYTDKRVVVSLRMGYHGRTLLSDVCTNVFGFENLPVGPNALGVAVGCNAYCYRCSFGLEYPDCEVACAANLEADLTAAGIDTIAAILAEPIQGVGGVIVSPPGYLQVLERIAHDHGGLLIVDEVQLGFGRTGTMFVSSQYDLSSDILVVGKAMANGMPMAAYIVRDEIGETIDRPTFSTSGGNPPCSAAALATIDYLIDHDLPEQARRAGERFADGLGALGVESRLTGNVRGRGLFVGMEMVLDHETREPATDEAFALIERCRDNGLLVGKSGSYGNVIRTGPPLTISDDQVSWAVEALGALRLVEQAA